MSMDRKNIEAIYPLSSMQQTFLFHSIQHPSTDLGFLQIEFHIEGALNVQMLQRAWQQVINRHQVLRTGIFWNDLPRPLQVVQRHVSAKWEYFDWRNTHCDTHNNCTEEQQKLNINALKNATKELGLQLGKAPLAHVSLMRLSDAHYHFICHCHHIVLDGWSGFLIIQELFLLYQKQLKKEKMALPIPLKYQHYINWIEQQDLTFIKKFWQQLLGVKDSNTADALVNTWPQRSGFARSHYLTLKKTLDEPLTQQLKNTCIEHKQTINCFLQGVWALLVSAHSGKKQNIEFGITLSGRTAPPLEGIEQAVGMFSTVLPMRVWLNKNSDFIHLLDNLSTQQLEINQYDYVSLAQVQHWCSTNVKTLFVLENYAPGDLYEESEQALKITDFHSGLTTNYPLTIAIRPGEELECDLWYDESYLSTVQACRFFDNWHQLLSEVILNPTEMLSSLRNKIEVQTTLTSFQSPQENNGGDLNSEVNTNITSYKSSAQLKPCSQTEKIMAQLWSDIIKTDSVYRDDNFFDLGGRSIMAASLISQIKEIFNIDLPIYQLFAYRTLAELSHFIEHQDGFKLIQSDHHTNKYDSKTVLAVSDTPTHQSWGNEAAPPRYTFKSLTPIQPKGSKEPLFCVPAAGNTALSFVNVARHLGLNQPLYGLNPLGVNSGDAPQQSVEAMAEHYIKEIKHFKKSGPYQLGGTCFGGHIAFEMAQQLHKNGERVSFLGLFDTTAPYKDQSDNLLTRSTEHLRYRLKREGFFPLISDLLIFRQTRRIKKRIENKWSPEKQRLNSLMQAHLVAVKNYIPTPYPGNVVVFRSEEYADLEQEAKGPWAVQWAEYVKGELSYRIIPCQHDDIDSEPALSIFCHELEKILDDI